MSLFGDIFNPGKLIGDIGSGFQSLFTNPGQNAANEQNATRQGVMNQYGSLLPGATSLAQGSQSFAQMMQPYLQKAIQQGIYQNSDQSALAGAQQQANYANSNAANSAKQAGLALSAQGAGSGAVSGATAGLFGQAANEANDAYTQAMSPEARQQRLMQRISQLMGAANPDYQPLQSVASGIYGAPTVQVQQNPLGGIIGTLGSAAINRMHK